MSGRVSAHNYLWDGFVMGRAGCSGVVTLDPAHSTNHHLMLSIIWGCLQRVLGTDGAYTLSPSTPPTTAFVLFWDFPYFCRQLNNIEIWISPALLFSLA